MKNLSDLIRKQRVKLGLTQADIARELKLTSPQYISNIERGLCAPSIETIKSLADILNLDAHRLVNIMVDVYRGRLEQEILGSSRMTKSRRAK